jgi:hypothetical protein
MCVPIKKLAVVTTTYISSSGRVLKYDEKIVVDMLQSKQIMCSHQESS